MTGQEHYAFRVGDRVHVEYDGIVRGTGAWPTTMDTFVQHGAGGFVAWLSSAVITKLPDPIPPEPLWQIGDAVIWHSRANGEHTLLYCGQTWVTQAGGRWHADAVTLAWNEGRLTRLIPEATPPRPTERPPVPEPERRPR